MEINQLRIRIKQVRQETPGAYTYELEEVNGKPIIYKAGQFITLLLNIGGQALRRSYSFSSTPGIDKYPCITVQRVVNGMASRYMIDNLKAGDQLDCLAPSGRFVVHDVQNAHCFITAGSGIVPGYSMIRYLLHHHGASILLFNQNRDEQSSIFRKSLLQLKDAYPGRFTMVEFFSQPLRQQIKPARLNNFLLEKMIAQYVTSRPTIFYLCGPLAFMRMAEFTLKVAGFEQNAIRKEFFDTPPAPPPPIPIDTAPKQVTVLYGDESLHFQVQYPDTLLQGARKYNIHFPFSCMGGRCSSCTMRLVRGKVHMTKNEVLTEKDIADGLVLSCVGYALEDVVLQVE